ncbi:MAG: hypothetical protein Q7S92_04785 [Candidatus Diapherotrites archaeon]|nr:hypothetical protein [Candidatus Diapherotrites archaeon]
MNTIIVLDSSALISLSETCLFDVFRALNKKLGIQFIMSQGVAEESIETPSTIKRFQLSSERIQKGLNEKWIQVAQMNSESKALEERMVSLCGKLFHSNGKFIQILHKGEAESLALMQQVNSRILCMDEKTTRMLIETPNELRELIQRRQGINIQVNSTILNELNQIIPKPIIIRSTELIALAYEEGLLNETITNTIKAARAALYAVKYAGCAVSEEEIENYLRKQK